jgi:hypothetical protein
MNKNSTLVSKIMKAVAMGMAVCVLVLNILKAANVETSIVILSIGLFALALDALSGGI